jgi:hypothetical protein
VNVARWKGDISLSARAGHRRGGAISGRHVRHVFVDSGLAVARGQGSNGSATCHENAHRGHGFSGQRNVRSWWTRAALAAEYTNRE